ncbi:hypothetical protein ACFU3E_37310 [Streptomyces sp. NPDC057424]|uniref:hypothetical protein n=1 Tax=Streptomyces sp. NPDC057424 TaxID=3346127 RepID=UPI00367810DF
MTRPVSHVGARRRSRAERAEGRSGARSGAGKRGHLSEDVIRVFHGQELITTVPRVTRKEVVVRKSSEHNRRKIV